MPRACGQRIVAAFGKAMRLVAAVALGGGLALAAAPGSAFAQAPQVVGYSAPLVIKNDRGGLVTRYIDRIKDLRRTGQPVEIRGEVCLSSCTMYLGLPQTCISRKTSFGFHGPSSYGAPLDQKTFDRWSRIIASHYPAPLAEWFMNDARHSIWNVRHVRGSELIRMGIRECASTS